MSQAAVYLAFETKAEALRTLWNTLLRGEEDVPPFAQTKAGRIGAATSDPQLANLANRGDVDQSVDRTVAPE